MNSKKNLVEKPKTAKPKVVAKPKATKKNLVEKPKPAKKATVNKSKTFAKPKATKKDLVEKPKPLDKPPKATKKATVNTLKEKPNNKKKKGGTLFKDLSQSLSGFKESVKGRISDLGRDLKTAFSSSSKTTSNLKDKPIDDGNAASDNDESNIKYITEIVKKAKEKLKDLLEKIKSMDLDPSFSDSERLSIIEIYDKCNNNYIESITDFDYKYSYEILINNNNNLKKQIKKTGFNETNKEELLILIKIFDLSKAIHHHYEDEDEDIKEEEDEDERNKQIIYDDVDLERLDLPK